MAKRKTNVIPIFTNSRRCFTLVFTHPNCILPSSENHYYCFRASTSISDYVNVMFLVLYFVALKTEVKTLVLVNVRDMPLKSTRIISLHHKCNACINLKRLKKRFNCPKNPLWHTLAHFLLT